MRDVNFRVRNKAFWSWRAGTTLRRPYLQEKEYIMRKLCPYRRHFPAGHIYTSKWGSFNILWSSAALLPDESLRFVHPSCLEDISLFRAILQHGTSSSGQWESNLEFPLTQPPFFRRSNRGGARGTSSQLKAGGKNGHERKNWEVKPFSIWTFSPQCYFFFPL